MHIRRLLYSDVGRIITSILLGLGLATIFRRVCKNRDCLVFHAAPLDKIHNQILNTMANVIGLTKQHKVAMTVRIF